MSETDVRMEILFAGQAKEVLFTLPASDYARFEDEYAAWKISGQAGVEFQYQEAARTTSIRYDQILSRSSITVAHHRKEQADASKAHEAAFEELGLRDGDNLKGENNA